MKVLLPFRTAHGLIALAIPRIEAVYVASFDPSEVTDEDRANITFAQDALIYALGALETGAFIYEPIPGDTMPPLYERRVKNEMAAVAYKDLDRLLSTFLAQEIPLPQVVDAMLPNLKTFILLRYGHAYRAECD